ncbi:unnamed protein product [Ectocarpus sp. 12 AP-2014]
MARRGVDVFHEYCARKSKRPAAWIRPAVPAWLPGRVARTSKQSRSFEQPCKRMKDKSHPGRDATVDDPLLIETASTVTCGWSSKRQVQRRRCRQPRGGEAAVGPVRIAPVTGKRPGAKQERKALNE